jgi:hypothetical protein
MNCCAFSFSHSFSFPAVGAQHGFGCLEVCRSKECRPTKPGGLCDEFNFCDVDRGRLFREYGQRSVRLLTAAQAWRTGRLPNMRGLMLQNSSKKKGKQLGNIKNKFLICAEKQKSIPQFRK